MVSRRNCAGPTGQPGLQVPGTCPALTTTTVPTNADEGVVATPWWVPVVVGGTITGAEVDGAVEEGTGTSRPTDGAWWAVIRGVLEHAANSPQERRPVTNTAARWRPGRGTDAHHSPRSLGPARAALGAVLLSVLASCAGPAHQAGTRHRV